MIVFISLKVILMVVYSMFVFSLWMGLIVRCRLLFCHSAAAAELQQSEALYNVADQRWLLYQQLLRVGVSSEEHLCLSGKNQYAFNHTNSHIFGHIWVWPQLNFIVLVLNINKHLDIFWL